MDPNETTFTRRPQNRPSGGQRPQPHHNNHNNHHQQQRKLISQNQYSQPSSTPSSSLPSPSSSSPVPFIQRGFRGEGGASPGKPLGYDNEKAVPFCPNFYFCEHIKDAQHTSEWMHPCPRGRSCARLNDPAHTRCWYHFNLPLCPNCERGRPCHYLGDPVHRASFHHNFPVVLRDYLLLCRHWSDGCRIIDAPDHAIIFQHRCPPVIPVDGVAPSSYTLDQEIKSRRIQSQQESQQLDMSHSQQQQQQQQENTNNYNVCVNNGNDGNDNNSRNSGGENVGENTSIDSTKKVIGEKEQEHEERNGDNGGSGQSKVLSETCRDFYSCHTRTRQGEHWLLHPCPRGVDCNLVDNPEHMLSHVHFICVPCAEGANCMFLTDPAHRAYFSHPRQFDYLTPCNYGPSCGELYEWGHCKRYQHLDHPVFPIQDPSEILRIIAADPTAKDCLAAPVDATPPEGRALCNHFYGCPFVGDKTHQTAALHPCLYGSECRDTTQFHKDHFYHLKLPLCPSLASVVVAATTTNNIINNINTNNNNSDSSSNNDGGSGAMCPLAWDPLHRAQYHHPGLFDYLFPCPNGPNCPIQGDLAHAMLFQHIDPPLFPCLPPIQLAHVVDKQYAYQYSAPPALPLALSYIIPAAVAAVNPPPPPLSVGPQVPLPPFPFPGPLPLPLLLQPLPQQPPPPPPQNYVQIIPSEFYIRQPPSPPLRVVTNTNNKSNTRHHYYHYRSYQQPHQQMQRQSQYRQRNGCVSHYHQQLYSQRGSLYPEKHSTDHCIPKFTLQQQKFQQTAHSANSRDSNYTKQKRYPQQQQHNQFNQTQAQANQKQPHQQTGVTGQQQQVQQQYYKRC